MMIMYQNLNSAATFDVMATDSWFPLIFDLPKDKAYSEEFENANMESTYTIMNLGSLLVVLVLSTL
jgi:hypothetical protein